MIAMKDIKKFIKKYMVKIIIYGSMGFGIPLIVVHILFKWHSGIEFLVAEWSAGDLLSYIGTILTFVGTIILSFLALQASNKANALSQKVIQNEEDRYKLQMRPFVLVTNWEAYEIERSTLIHDPQEKYIRIGSYDTGKAIGLALYLTNTTESYITVSYSCGKHSDTDRCWGYLAENQENLKMTLQPGASDKFVFYAEPAFMKKQAHQWVTIELFLENRFSRRYKETVDIHITALSDNCFGKPGKWYCHLVAQNYTIGRFEKNEDGKILFIEEKL